MDGMTDLSDSQETNSSSSSSDESDYSISFTEGTAITSQKRNLDDEEKKNDKPIENSEFIAIESLYGPNIVDDQIDSTVLQRKPMKKCLRKSSKRKNRKSNLHFLQVPPSIHRSRTRPLVCSNLIALSHSSPSASNS